jgi:2-polyprenyl-3-methyl-5-hydroxy-6-metoxy-1,4-benzoquinol methylase/ribosomal protein S27AE
MMNAAHVIANEVKQSVIWTQEFFCPACGRSKISLDHNRCDDCGFDAGVEDGILDLHPLVRDKDYRKSSAENLAKVYDRHFWYRARNRVILDVLNKAEWKDENPSIADLGCGNGYVMAKLEQAGYRVLGSDMHIRGLHIARQVAKGPIICALLEDIKLVEPLDAVCLFDVVEHIENQQQALKLAVSLVNPGGYILVTVPALKMLWSDFDVSCGHKRRYDRRMLKQLLADCGLETVYISYFFMFSVLPVWLQRKSISKHIKKADRKSGYTKPPPRLLNSIFSMLSGIERFFSLIGIKPPLGTSLVGLAQVPKKL